MNAYKLIQSIPGLKAGAVFVHDIHDHKNGSRAHGCLKLAWENGMCQQGWCAGTFVFPGQLVQEEEWFAPVDNPQPPPPKEKHYV